MRMLCRLSLKVVPSNAGNAVAPRNGGRIETTFQNARRLAVAVVRVFAARACGFCYSYCSTLNAVTLSIIFIKRGLIG